MRISRFILFILGILAATLQTTAQQGGNDPERFYNVDSYKANITLTFQYRFSESDPEYSRLTNVSQTFQHFFTTAPGQISAADMFQIERGDKVEVGSADNTNQDEGIMGGMDMDAISQALQNSGIETIEHDGKEVNVMEMLNQAKKETESYNMDLEKYKMWMAVPLAGGEVSSSIYSKYNDEETGSMHCGEGQGKGTFTSIRNYSGSAHVDAGQQDIVNPNGFILLLNLANNSYSFSANVNMPPGFEFKGNLYQSDCGTSSDEPINMNARSFINIRAEKEGLVYKSPLPGGGMILSGSEIITDRFNLWGSLEKEANWGVRVDWTIFPADMGVPEVFIRYKNEAEAEKWLPADTNDIEAIMEWEGNYLPEIIEWELSNVSAEPGTCLNSKDKNEEFDLEFEESLNENGYNIMKTETGYIARKEGNNKVGEESILIKSRDYGSYGLLSGKIKVNGIWCDAYDKELGNNGISIPLDKNYNNIADAWEKEYLLNDEFPNNWDKEENSVLENDKFPGDGLSLYEEYRGLETNGDGKPHMRLDPNKKELIVIDETVNVKIRPGLDLFESASEITIVLLKEGELPESRIVNSNHATGYNGDQHGVIFKNAQRPDPTGIAGACFPLETLNKTPKLVDYIMFYPSLSSNNNETPSSNYTESSTGSQSSNGSQSQNSGREQEIICKTPCPALEITSEDAERIRNETIAHEIGHAVGLNHHGDTGIENERVLRNYESDRLVYDYKGNPNNDGHTKEKKEIKERPYTICCPIGSMHGQSSGSLSCIMRYNNLYQWRYEVTGGTIAYYKEGSDLKPLNTFCTSDDGGTNPYGDAKTGQGNCLGRLKVKDY